MEMEICKIRDENRNLHCQLARVVLLEAIEKDGAFLPNGVAGNCTKQAVGIIDSSISDALQSHAALVKLELRWLHTEHIAKVCACLSGLRLWMSYCNA
jgi:hypothetical protein